MPYNSKWFFYFVTFVVLSMTSALVRGENSLSDLAIEQLERESMATGGRNPFTPADVSGGVDIASLTLEGILLGPQVKLALVSGRIVQEGSPLGAYTVSKILPGEIILASALEEQHLQMEGYLPPLREGGNQGLDIEFRRADIRDALRFLAKAQGYNLITPEDISGRVSLSFTDTSVLDAIKSILKVNHYSFAIENEILRVGKSDQFVGKTDLLATTISLKYATAKDLVKKIEPLLSDQGSVTAEDRSNILSVKDYDANVESAKKLVQRVDKKDRQVAIEAHIVDATNDFGRSLGIQWGVAGTPDRVTISGGDKTGTFAIGSNTATPSNVNLGALNPTSALGFRIARLPGNTNIDLQLSAAESRGDVKILSKPTVTTINNMPARIRSGVKIYVKSTSNISVGTTAGTGGGSQQGLQTIETGVQLKVTPQISPNDVIKLTIEATESEADFSKTVDGIPAVLDNTATTTVFLRDGETAVIGGLIKRKDTLTKRSVPGFSKIPVLGLFFKSKTNTKTQSELMIFITPRILD